MGTRGRQSDISLATSSAVIAIQRPRPPDELSEEQAQEWAAIVNRLPAEWFPRETWPILAAYCRHSVAARRVAALITECETGADFDLETYERLLKMQERESRALTALGRSMRVTQQSTYDAKKTKPLKGTKRPWETE